jgi:lipopolysaccharide export system permease protein
LRHIGHYYFQQSTLIFDRLSEAIVLLAAMFTVAWVQRSNELLPLLSAGVSTRRFLAPVLACACALVLVNVANQEFLIPVINGEPLLRDDPDNQKKLVVNSKYEPNGINIKGDAAVRNELKIINFHCVIPDSVANGTPVILKAEFAYYKPPDCTEELKGGWLLVNTRPEEIYHRARNDVLKPLGPGRYFLHTAEVDFDVLTRDRKWYQQQSTWVVFQALGKTDTMKLASMAVFFHMRLTRPILGLILVFMGLSVILRDQNRNVFISAGYCLILCAVFFAAISVAKYLGDTEILNPALAAWLPVFIFGPLAFALFDAVHT